MPLKTKNIKIGEFDINIIQFNALEAIKLRKELVYSVKKQAGNISGDTNDILKGIAGLIYEMPSDLYMKLFKNCSAGEIGELSKESNFNEVFNSNLDGIHELAIEVLDFNGFFSLKLLSILTKKFPILAPFQETIQQEWGEMKTDLLKN
jgi:hypothetical protein